jgi:hypothetical protein
MVLPVIKIGWGSFLIKIYKRNFSNKKIMLKLNFLYGSISIMDWNQSSKFYNIKKR